MINRLVVFLIAWTLTFAVPCTAQQALTQPQLSTKPAITSEGLDYGKADALVTPAHAYQLINLHMLTEGCWTNRTCGYSLQRAAVFDSSDVTAQTNNFTEIAAHYDSTGNQQLIFSVGSKLYEYNLDTSTETQLTGASLDDPSQWNAPPCFRSYSPTVFVIADGHHELQNWDGNTGHAVATATGWPITFSSIVYSKPTVTEPFLAREAYAGFPSQPFTVLISGTNTPNAFALNSPVHATDGGTFTLPASYGPILGLKTLRMGNAANDQILIVGCLRAMCLITGTDATNFAMHTITDQYGLLSDRGWIQIGNDLYYPASDGIRRFSMTPFGTMQQDIVSRPVERDYMQVTNEQPFPDTSKSPFTTYPKGCRNIFAFTHTLTKEIWWWQADESAWPSGNQGFYDGLIMSYHTTPDLNGSAQLVWSSVGPGSGWFSDTVVPGSVPYNDRPYSFPRCGIEIRNNTYMGTNPGYLFQLYTNGSHLQSILGHPEYMPWFFTSPLIETDPQNPTRSSSSRRITILSDMFGVTCRAKVFVEDADINGNSKIETALNLRINNTGVTGYSSSYTPGIGFDYAETLNHGSRDGSGISFTDLDAPGTGRYWGVSLSAEQLGDDIDVVGVVQQQLVGGVQQ